jgi:hypothetical protein
MPNVRRKSATAAVFLMGIILLAGMPVESRPWFLFVTTTDYSTGSCSTIELDGSYAVTQNVASIHSDAVARYHDGYIYVINRYGADNIRILDPDNAFATVREFSTGNLSNPQDVAFAAPNKMYVSRNNSNTLWIGNPQTGAQTGSIDLSAFADADGLCEMQYMLLVGDRLFVSIQRLDRNTPWWPPVGTSYVAVIDTGTDTLVDVDPGTPGTQAIQLAYADPFSEIQIDPLTGYLYVSCVGFSGLLDGGVELIDTATLSLAGTMLAESAAAGDIRDVEIVDGQVGYAIIQNTSFNTDLIMFNPSAGTKTQTIYSPGDYVIQDIDLGPTGELFLSDRTPLAPGIRVYEALSGAEITSSPIDVGLPPFDLTFGGDAPTGAGTPASVASLGQNYPNPFNPSTTIPFSLERSAHVVLEIFDVTGVRVALLIDEFRPAGQYEPEWDGRSAGSSPLPSGLYFARLRAGGYVQYQKMVLLK